MMKFLFLSGLLLVLAATGCGQKKSPSAKPSESASENGNGSSDSTVQPQANEPPVARQPSSRPARRTQAAIPPPAPASNESGPLEGIVHPFMTEQLKRFIGENGRLPKDFAEFAAARMDSVPRAPEGLRFAIDPTTQEVKLVRK